MPPVRTHAEYELQDQRNKVRNFHLALSAGVLDKPARVTVSLTHSIPACQLISVATERVLLT